MLGACAGLLLAQESADTPPGIGRQIAALVEKADANKDDWLTEKLHLAVKKQLKKLGAILERCGWDKAELASLVAAGARSTPLRPHSPKTKLIAGGITVCRTRTDRAAIDSAESVADALHGLTAPLARFGGRRVAFKVSGVTASDAESFTTRVLYEAFGQADSSVTQQTAAWNVRWDSGTDPEHPLITAIDSISFDELSRPAAAFSDCTATVLRSVAGWREQVLYGAEHWYGKIDAVGELNFMGHQGIAVADVNGDGLEDVYVAMGTGLPNKLLLQNADGTVRDVAAEAKVAWLDDTKGVLFADMDNDGDQDLLLAMGPSIVLGKNDGTGKFVRFVRLRPTSPAAFYSLAVADYDLDGDLDIYGCRYVKVRYGVSFPIPFHDANNGPTNHLMRNDGDDVYVDVTEQVGLGVHNTRFSLAAGWADYDDDGDPDLYVANDFGRNNLYRNDRGRFVDVAAEAGVEDQAAGMGVSWSDFDLDGDLDLYVSNMFSSAGQRIAYQERFHTETGDDQRNQIRRHSSGNSLLVNQGDGTFVDMGGIAGVRMGRWSWGARFVDLNNDGYDDLLVPNGFLSNDRVDDL